MFPSLPARFKVPYLLKNDYSRPCSQSGGLRFRTHSSDLSKVYDACLQCHWGRQRRADIMFNFTTPPTSHPLVSSVGKHSAPEIVDPPPTSVPSSPVPYPRFVSGHQPSSWRVFNDSRACRQREEKCQVLGDIYDKHVVRGCFFQDELLEQRPIISRRLLLGSPAFSACIFPSSHDIDRDAFKH